MPTARSSRVILAKAASACVIGAALAALIGQAGRWWTAADMVNIALPLWAAAGATGFAAAIALGGAGTATVAAFFLLAAIGVAMTAPEIGGARGRPPTGASPALRIVQFNAFKHNREPDRAAAWILAQRPDVVTMEEALANGRGIVARLRTALPYQVSCLSHMRCSTVILSRTPFAASGGLARGDPENRKTLSAVWAQIERPDGAFTLVATHMLRPWPPDAQENGRRRLAAFLATRDKADLIVAGDFNLPPWTFIMRRQDRAFGLARLTRGLPTWPTAHIGGGADLPSILPIDHLYAGRRWRLGHIERSPWIGSDHRAIAATLYRDVPGL